MMQAGWFLVFRPATVTGHGPDAILYHPEKDRVRFIDNKAYHKLKSLGKSSFKCLTTNFRISTGLARGILTAAVKGTGDPMAAAALKALNAGATERVITTFFGKSITLAQSAISAGVRLMTKAEVHAEAAAFAEAAAKHAGRGFKGALKAFGRVIGSATLAVAGFVFMMENTGNASEFSPESDVESLFFLLRKKGIPIDNSEPGDKRIMIEKLTPKQLEAAVVTAVKEWSPGQIEDPGRTRRAVAYDMYLEWIDVLENSPFVSRGDYIRYQREAERIVDKYIR